MATRITPEIIELIKKYRIENKLGSGKISQILKANHKIDVGISTITKELKKLKDQGIKGIDIAPADLAAADEQRIYAKGEKRNIYKKIRPIGNYNRKTNSNLPTDAKFKVQLPSGSAEGSSTVTKYFKTKKEAEAGIKAAESLSLKNKQLKLKPFDDAVKAINKIALKDADEISDINNLAKLVYGDNKLRQLTDVSNDLVKYQQFLLGFKEIPGLTKPSGAKLDNILTEFPPQNQWGKFAANELRRSKFEIRDKILKTKGKKLSTLREGLLKGIDTGVFNLDEAMGLSATFENAPGYTELGQVIKKKVNVLKGREIDKPFSKLFKDTIDGKASAKDISSFNKKSQAFQIKHGVDTPIIEYRPGEKLDASKFVKHFDKLSVEAQANVSELAEKGIALKSNAMPMSSSAFNSLQSKLISSTNKLPKADQLKFCSLLSKGGLPGDCKQALKADPEKAAKILSEAPVTSAAMKDVKGNAQKMIRLFRGESFPNRTNKEFKAIQKISGLPLDTIKKDALSGQWFSSNPSTAKSYTNKLGKTKYVDVTPKEYLAMQKYRERVNRGNFISGNPDMPTRRTQIPVTDANSMIPRYKLKEFEKTGRMKSQSKLLGDVKTPAGTIIYDPIKGGFIDAGETALPFGKRFDGSSANVSTEQLKAWATENPMPVKAGTEDALKPIKGNLLKTVGKSLAYVGAPLPTALIDSYFVGRQISEDKSAAEIAKDPLNWLGLATMSSLSNISGVTKPGKVNAALRLGMSPGLIRGVSRFAGLPGLAISTALTAYDQYEKYKNEEGLIYNFFNKGSKAI